MKPIKLSLAFHGVWFDGLHRIFRFLVRGVLGTKRSLDAFATRHGPGRVRSREEVGGAAWILKGPKVLTVNVPKQKIWGRVAGSWILPHMQRAAPWGTGDGVVNFPVRFARKSGFQMLATAHTTNLLKWPGCKGWRWAGLFLRIEIRLFDFGFFIPFWPAICTTTHLSFSDSCQQFVLVISCLEGLTSATLLRLWMILSWNLYRICRPPSPLVKGASVSEADGGRAQALRPCGLKSLEQRHCVEWWDSGKGWG